MTAMPSSLLHLAATNPTAASSEVAAEFQEGTVPWFSSLPTDVQSYLLTVNGNRAPSPTSPVSTRSFYVATAFQKRPSITPTASSTSTSTPAPSQDQSILSQSTRIGVGIGVAAGVCCFGLLVVTTVLLRKARTRRRRDAEEEEESGDFRPPVPEKAPYQTQELDAVETSMSGAVWPSQQRKDDGVVHELAERTSLRVGEITRVEFADRYG
jgi:hypothetical protein